MYKDKFQGGADSARTSIFEIVILKISDKISNDNDDYFVL